MDIEKDLAEHVELAPLTKQNLADAENENSGNMGLFLVLSVCCRLSF